MNDRKPAEISDYGWRGPRYPIQQCCSAEVKLFEFEIDVKCGPGDRDAPWGVHHVQNRTQFHRRGST
jgi:hypothetical protein